MIATTTEESRARKSAWLKHGCNVFDAKRPLSAPFSFWTDNDILTYIHQENLPVADAYGKVVPEDDGIDGQINMFEEIGYEGCRFKTTGCPRTGCIYCLFGITQDINRIIRLYEWSQNGQITCYVEENLTMKECGYHQMKGLVTGTYWTGWPGTE